MIRCKKAESTYKWFSCNGEYTRCIQTKFTDLEYSDRVTGPYLKLGKMGYGCPKIFAYDPSHLSDYLFVTEKSFGLMEESLEDLRTFNPTENIDFSQIINDILGEG